MGKTEVFEGFRVAGGHHGTLVGFLEASEIRDISWFYEGSKEFQMVLGAF